MMTSNEFWEAVTEAFYKIPGYQFEIFYLIQMQILNSIVETKGGNSFKVPHAGISKEVHEEESRLKRRRKRFRCDMDPRIID